MSAGELLACPRCGQASGLATIEEMTGTARATFYEDDIVWDGWTDVDWGSSNTIGVACHCGWTYHGADCWEVLRNGGGDGEA